MPTEHCDTDSSTDDYARRFAGTVGEWMLSRQADTVLQLLRPWPGATVLDVGGGHAQLGGPLGAAGYRVTILGSDPVCGQRPRRLLGQRTPFVVGDISDPPYADQSFDITIAVRLMAHVQDWHTLVRGLCRVARRAVIIDFATPISVNAIAPLLFRAKKQLERNTRPFNLQRRGHVQRAFAEEGFGRFRGVGQYVAPMALHRGMKAPRLSQGIENVLQGLCLGRIIGSPVILRAERLQNGDTS
jgi:hypothetical protein